MNVHLRPDPPEGGHSCIMYIIFVSHSVVSLVGMEHFVKAAIQQQAAVNYIISFGNELMHFVTAIHKLKLVHV